MKLRSLSISLFLLTCLVQAQVSAPAQDSERKRDTTVKDAVQGGWSYSRAESREAIDADDAQAPTPQDRLDDLRAVRNEALVKNQGQLTPADRAELERMAGEVNTAFPQSFEAHLAGFYAEFPAPASFTHVDLATARDPNREEIIAPQLVNSARKDQREELVRWSSAMKERGEVAPALYRLAEDMLASVEKNGVLIAAGEMDAYPMWVEQYADGKRNDVLVIDQRLLGDPAYRSRMWERTKAKGTLPIDGPTFIERLPSSIERPVFLSLAVGAQVAGKYKGNLSVTGLALRIGAPAQDDITKLEDRWKKMNKALDAGPLARNYLVPGAVLLKHYRAIEDESKASAMEAELRAMAARTGATRLLFENGVLLH